MTGNKSRAGIHKLVEVTMKKSHLLSSVFACALSFISLTVHAVPVSGQGTWESTLQGRDLDGNLSTFEAYYDTVQDITWLANANAAGPPMTWWTANTWAVGLNINGITGWRLPVTAASCQPGGPCPCEGFNCADREMGRMYYNVLGNTAGSLTNTGPFSNLQSSGYWSATRPIANFRFSWTFNFGNGFQRIKDNTEFPPFVVTQYAWAVHSGDVGVPVEIITIDIKPDSDPNSINLKSKGKIPVAILTTDTFDATQVDWESVLFGPEGATESHGRSHVEDVDDNGNMDVVLHFNTQDSGIACGDIEATLTGETFGGEAITGTDSVTIVKCP